MGEATVEIATTSVILSGRCTAYEHSGRLADLLRQAPILVLTECEVRPLWQPSGPIVTRATCHVPVGHIVWARPIEEPGSASERHQGSEDDRVEKVPHPLVALARQFVISGKVHLVEGADPTLALERLAQGFLPITDAKVSSPANEAAGWEAPFIALNGSLVELFSLE
jgi:hypothetical protein